MRDFIDAGFEAIVVSVNADLFDNEWLGRRIEKDFVRDLASFNSAIDPCGEHGEYHTFVIDGPLFKNHVRILKNERILKDGYWFLDISGYASENREGEHHNQYWHFQGKLDRSSVRTKG
jgi:diphthine-ammonia ligase